REMRWAVGPQLAREQDAERGWADAVRVVVAVDADLPAACDRRGDRLDGGGHVAKTERVVAGRGAVEEPARVLGVGELPADEDRCRHVVEIESRGQLRYVGVRARCKLPGTGRHAADEGTAGVGRNPRNCPGNLL